MATTKWALDATHSEVLFKVKHLLISKVTGQFQKFDASVETEGDDLGTARVTFTADVHSVSTNNEQRDAHLRNSDFFDVEKYAQLTFTADKLQKIDDEHYTITGTLTMHGISKQETLHVEYGGMVKDPWGNTRVGFTVTGKVNRKDYGISFGMVSETGGALLGYDVEIHVQAEFVKVVP
ncbi:MAG TPA: YceI family protein [Puia sp.]|jgi:polyisoprenoid-binding protein YceI|nr:YceI family protein [Puia sp.]